MMKALCAGLAALTAATAANAQVERANFDTSPFSLGMLTEQDGALPRDLWEGATADEVEELLRALPTRFDDPAKRMILRRVLLSPGSGPEGADAELAGLKLLRAAEAGYVAEAGALAELNPGLAVQPELSRIVAMRDLYFGELDAACARGANLREGRQTPFFIKLRAFCYINASEIPAAELTISLAREEGVLTPDDEMMFAALFSGQPPASLPRDALQYASYRRLVGLFSPDDVALVAPPVVAAVAMDEGLGTGARQAALMRAAREDLLGPRDLGDAAASLDGTVLASVVTGVRNRADGSPERATAIGEALVTARNEPDDFLLRTRIFARDIASLRPDGATVPFAVEFALASLLNRRFDDAERWMQSVAEEQSIGAERAFLNLAKLYSYTRLTSAQRLAGAIGERLPEPPEPTFTIGDSGAAASIETDLAGASRRGVMAVATGSQGAALLGALATAAVRAEGELAAVRDSFGRAMFDAAGAAPLIQEAAAREAGLAFAGRLRADTVNKQPFIPRLKPETRR